MGIIKIYYDLETTGVNYKRHGVHQIAGIVEVNAREVETFNFKVRPNPRAEITPEAMAVCRVTAEEILAYRPMEAAYQDFIALLSKYINKYDKTQKAYLVGFNNRFFDDQFLRAWFSQNGDTFFNSWFWPDTLDVMVLASQYLINRRPGMPSFKLHRVAKELGLEVDATRNHDALYDVGLTRDIYYIVTGLEIE